MNFYIILSVGIGGMLGALVRFFASTYINKVLGTTFAYGTLCVNILGSLIIGFLFLYFQQTISPNLKAMLMTGFLGALTTFSTFSLETLLMAQDGQYVKAFLNIFLNIILSLTATVIGMLIYKKIYG